MFLLIIKSEFNGRAEYYEQNLCLFSSPAAVDFNTALIFYLIHKVCVSFKNETHTNSHKTKAMAKLEASA